MRHQLRKVNRERERQLRVSSTEAERILWAMLRDRRLSRWKFRRQHRVGLFVLDFYCAPLRLGFEADGAQHHTDNGIASDSIRDAALRELGIHVVRIDNTAIVADPENVRRDLLLVLQRREMEMAAPHP